MTPKSQDPKAFLLQAAAHPNEKTAKIAFRGTEAYRTGLSIYAKLSGEDVQSFLEKAIQVTVNSEVVPVPGAINTNHDSDKIHSQAKPGDKWERARKQLRDIENSTDDEAQKAILANLSVFARKLQSAPRERKNPAVPPKGTKPDILEEVPGLVASADRAVAETNHAPTIINRDRKSHNGNKQRNPRSGTSGGSGSKG